MSVITLKVASSRFGRLDVTAVPSFADFKAACIYPLELNPRSVDYLLYVLDYKFFGNIQNLALGHIRVLSSAMSAQSLALSMLAR